MKQKNSHPDEDLEAGCFKSTICLLEGCARVWVWGSDAIDLGVQKCYSGQVLCCCLSLHAEGCFSYDVILIVESECLQILPLNAWPICLIMIALTCLLFDNCKPYVPCELTSSLP